MKNKLFMSAAMIAALALAGCNNSNVTPAETEAVDEEIVNDDNAVQEDNETVFETDGADAAEAEEVEGTVQE